MPFPYPLFDQVEPPEHKVDVDEDDAEANDEVGHVCHDGGRGNLVEAVGNIHLTIQHTGMFNVYYVFLMIYFWNIQKFRGLHLIL